MEGRVQRRRMLAATAAEWAGSRWMKGRRTAELGDVLKNCRDAAERSVSTRLSGCSVGDWPGICELGRSFRSPSAFSILITAESSVGLGLKDHGTRTSKPRDSTFETARVSFRFSWFCREEPSFLFRRFYKNPCLNLVETVLAARVKGGVKLTLWPILWYNPTLQEF